MVEGESGAFSPDAEVPDTGGGCSAAIVADEKLVAAFELVSGAGVIGQTGRAGGKIGDRRNDMSGLVGEVGLPHFLLHPLVNGTVRDAGRFVEGMEDLVAHAPSGVGSVHHEDDTRAIALVGIVINGDGGAVLVEGNFLGVAEAKVDHFKVGPVGVEAEDGTLVGVFIFVAFPGGEAEATVADGGINAAVGSKSEAVEIVAGEGNAYSHAILYDLALVRDEVAVFVGECPDFGNAGEVDGAFEGHDASGGSVQDFIEALGEDFGFIGHTVSVGVSKDAHFFGEFGEIVDRLFVVPLLVHRNPVIGGLRGNVVHEPIEMPAVILDTRPETVGFGDKDAALFID